MTLEGPKMVTSIPGPKAQELLKVREKYVPVGLSMAVPTFAVKGEGVLVEDCDGNVFLDFAGGIGVLNIGYSNPEVVAAVKDQVDKFFHTSINVLLYEGYVRLAEKLATMVPGPSPKKVLFVNSGAEAIENAVKVARKATGKHGVICYEGAFHGRTYLTLSLTSKIKPYKTRFGPFAAGITRIPFPYCYRCPYNLDKESCGLYCAEKLYDVFTQVADPDDTAALLMEPQLGEGGFVPAPFGYIERVAEICKEFGVLLIIDEVQTGFCRTGKMFCQEYYDVEPDITTLAKSMGAGMPLSAVVMKASLLENIKGGEIGGTYAGNPVSCAAALKTIEIYERDDYAAKSQHIGDVCRARFEAWMKKYPERIGEVRGLGGMIALEFIKDSQSKKPDKDAVKAILLECYQNGLVLLDSGVYGNNIRILVPLCITDAQLDTGLDIMGAALEKILK